MGSVKVPRRRIACRPLMKATFPQFWTRSRAAVCSYREHTCSLHRWRFVVLIWAVTTLSIEGIGSFSVSVRALRCKVTCMA